MRTPHPGRRVADVPETQAHDTCARWVVGRDPLWQPDAVTLRTALGNAPVPDAGSAAPRVAPTGARRDSCPGGPLRPVGGRLLARGPAARTRRRRRPARLRRDRGPEGRDDVVVRAHRGASRRGPATRRPQGAALLRPLRLHRLRSHRHRGVPPVVRPPGRHPRRGADPRLHVPALGRAPVRAAAPATRLLVVVRDPVERFVSGLAHEGAATADVHRGAVVAEAYVWGCYASLLRPWVAQFGAAEAPPRVAIRAVRGRSRRRAGPHLRFLGLDDEVRRPPASRTSPARHAGPSCRWTTTPGRGPAALYASEVSELAEMVPDLDLDLWPNRVR